MNLGHKEPLTPPVPGQDDKVKNNISKKRASFYPCPDAFIGIDQKILAIKKTPQIGAFSGG